MYFSIVTYDDEYTLFSVVIFRRVRDEFLQKCRENKSVLKCLFLMQSLMASRYIVRDFHYSEDQLSKEREEFKFADITEKELWVRQHLDSLCTCSCSSSSDGALETIAYK